MRVKFWGVRGSIPVPGNGFARYGGNTSCVEVTLSDGSELILDAGTGIRELGRARDGRPTRATILLTHLHLDHIQGLLFFPPLFDPRGEVTVCGPPAFRGSLLDRLARYMSAPLSPVEMRELPARVTFEDIAPEGYDVGPAHVTAALVNHRGPTLGYRIEDSGATLCYIPDHEPALGQSLERDADEWISGLELARGADLVVHDCQFLDREYAPHLGWGHCALGDALAFFRRSGAPHLALFHHDPVRDDDALDAIADEAAASAGGARVEVAAERRTIELPAGAASSGP